MDGEDYKDMREESRNRKKVKQEEGYRIISEWCEQHDFAYEKITPYQIRFVCPIGTIDIFPTSRKTHNITKQIRGAYGNLGKYLTTLL